MPREQAMCHREKINLYDYAPKKNLHPFLENGQIQAVRMTGAESKFTPQIIVGKCCFSPILLSLTLALFFSQFSFTCLQEKHKQMRGNDGGVERGYFQ